MYHRRYASPRSTGTTCPARSSSRREIPRKRRQHSSAGAPSGCSASQARNRASHAPAGRTLTACRFIGLLPVQLLDRLAFSFGVLLVVDPFYSLHVLTESRIVIGPPLWLKRNPPAVWPLPHL